jgi:hypothetical protein
MFAPQGSTMEASQTARRSLGKALAAGAVATAVISVVLGLPAHPARAVNAEQPRLVSANPADWTPNVTNGQVRAVAQVGSRMIVGGTFTQVQNAGSGTTLTRNYILAFNATTGAVDTTFVPALDGAVYALVPAPDGRSVFVGGAFATVNGASVKGLTELDTLTGQASSSFSAPTDGTVFDAVVTGNRLFVGGAFGFVRGVHRTLLASVDVNTGAVDPNFHPAFSTPRTGTLDVMKFDISPDGTRLVAIGNFTVVDGLDRYQAVMLDLSTTPARVANWETDRYKAACSSSFATYMRGIDFSPDGAYFVVVTTGAYFANTLCDTAARWETAASGSALQPTWADYTGGDTLYSVAITGTAVYIGGHERWANNSFTRDAAGPGAVYRPGIGALDPVNGMPFSWNPTKDRGVGTFQLLATSAGLWEVSDTTTVAGEYHARLAFFPIASGEVVPPDVPASLPGELYSLPMSGCSGPDNSILYRVNAGGGALPSLDCGLGWADDSGTSSPYRNSGSTAATYGAVGSVNASVPATTPSQVFSSERWDPSTSPEMQWSFPVPAGTHLKVRLYFANQCGCTNKSGQRVFNVAIDGTTVLSNYDIVADVGNEVGTMKQFTVTSDGTVNIDFTHNKNNPLINAIEIVNTDVSPGPQPGVVNFLNHRSFDGTSFGSSQTFSTPSVDWSHARGAFVVNGNLYTGWDNGAFYVRSFDGTNLGTATADNLNGLTNSYFPVSGLSGMFFDGDTGRLYYTVTGDARMYYRYFEPEDGIVGADTFVASGNGDGLDWRNVRGMTMADGNIYYGQSNHNMYRIRFANGVPQPGTSTVISGPATGDGNDWLTDGLFLIPAPDGTPPTVPGRPSGTSTMPGSINLTWAASSDDHATSIIYGVYRDGDPNAVGTVTSSSTATVSFTDTGLAVGSTHTYQVDASDGSNVSAKSLASDPITVGGGVVFSDDFSGGLGQWTKVVNLTIDNSTGAAAAPSALASASGAAAYAAKDLGADYPGLCETESVNLSSIGSSTVVLMRFRTAANGAIARLFLLPSRVLYLKSDVAGLQASSGFTLPLNAWTSLEMCGSVGSPGTLQLYVNGASVLGPWNVDLGTAPIERVEAGSASAATFTMNLDDVIVQAQ